MLNLNLLMNILPQVGLVTIVIVIISFSIHEFIDKVVMTAQKVCNANIELRSVL